MKVGVFDSGLGGLTVLAELLKAAQGVEFYYLGDTARVPYGIRSTETVRRYALESARFLMEFGVDALVVACNTVSARAFDFLKEKLPKTPVFEVVSPAVAEAARTAKKTVGVIGTPATVTSGVYERKLKAVRNDLKVLQKATPLLVPLAEEGLVEGPVAETVLNHYLSPWRGKIDLLLLGCTHYPLLEKTVKKLFPEWKVVNSARPLARKLKPLLKGGGKNGVHLFFTDRTAFLDRFLASVKLEGEVRNFEVVSLE
ncbi:MAG: glutamate racemase [Aquificae bacterium]|nr:glutamate racemase [Aquificota bacterium]